MAEHRLKTWPMIFKEVKAGNKTFEVRFNDRNFQVGDTLILEEYLPTNGNYTGDRVTKRVTYILEGDKFGVQPGYVVMSIK
jgi:ASC-1-like (ASCH) protein